MTSSRGRRRGSSKISSRVNKKSVSKRVGEDSSESSDNEASRDLHVEKSDAGTGGGDTYRAQPAEESEDDCPVYNDEDFAVEGGDEDCALVVVGDPVGGGDNDDNDDNEGGLGAVNSNIADDFPKAAIEDAIEDQAGSASESGDDIWDDDKIPDPSSSDDEDEDRDREHHVDDPEVLIALEKTYNSSDEFKQGQGSQAHGMEHHKDHKHMEHHKDHMHNHKVRNNKGFMDLHHGLSVLTRLLPFEVFFYSL